MITFVVGTRPELIKIAPVVEALQKRNAPLSIVHTGQHYSYELDAIFFEELGLPKPVANLEVGSSGPAQQLGTIIIRSAEALAKLQPRWVLVQGDTNSVLGGALAAYKLGIPIAHLEAGLRSDDWDMPEEANRVLAGRVAALHLCPTAGQVERLRRENIIRGVHVVGNTVVDAALMNAKRARDRSQVIERLGLQGKRYALVTLHRPSNVDSEERLRAVMRALGAVAKHHEVSLVFPTHPRTRATIARMADGRRFSEPPFITTDPVGYLDFLRLLADAQLTLTDSGGVQEEACTLRVPCVTLRANTERPETVDVGANVLCDSTEPGVLESAVEGMLARKRDWANPFGDGHAGERVVDLLLDPKTRRVPSGAP
ncbi:MAG: UDP-N-acetylglucosamine 2-epimerase (non-hydrolyzing) [Myxococcales bacterium]